MSHRENRLDSVVKVTGDRENDALRHFGQCQRELAQRRHQLDELIGYRDEYGSQFANAGGDGFSAAQLHEYRAFLNSLNQAIEQQTRLVEETHLRHERSRRQWLESRRKAKGVAKVVDRRREQERSTRDRREQKESDERAQHSRRPE